MATNKRKILQSAQKHLQKGALEKALKDYQTLLGADPRDANIRLKIGDLQLRRGDTIQAIEAYLRVAEQFMKDGFDAKAVAIYKQVHKIDGERQRVWEPLAELYQRMGLTAEAMVALQTAADAHHQEGRRREALDLLRKMASLDPTNTTSRLKVAELLRADDRDSEAALEYREAAAEFERQGEREGAASALEKAIELLPDELELHEHVVRVHLGAGNAARAEPLARRLIELDPDAPSGYEQLAAVLQALGQEDALSDVYRSLAEAHRKRGEEDQARAILQRFVPVEHLSDAESQRFEATGLSEETESAETLDFGDGHDLEVDPGSLAVEDTPVFGDLSPIGEGPSGIEEDEAASAPTPSEGDQAPVEEDEEADPDQLLAEASVYLRYGKHDRAITSLQSVLAAQPRHAAALEKLGEAWTVAERPEEAVKAFVQAAELAREAADAERFDVLRGRVEALDAVAAAALGALAPLPESEEEHGYLEDDVEFSVDDGLDEFEEELAAADTASGEPPEPQRGPDEDADVTPAAVEGGESAASSHTTPQQIIDDFEAAEFYRQQGLVDEAEDLYGRVLELAPGHPQAMLRLGEIEAARDEAAQAAGVGQEEGQHDRVAELAREAFAPEDAGEPPAATVSAETSAAGGLAHELAEDSFGLGDETPDPFGFADEADTSEPDPLPEPAPDPDSELEFVQESEPEALLESESAPDPVSDPDPEQGQAEVTLPGIDALEAASTEAPAPSSDADEAEGFDLAAALTDALEDEAAGGEATTEEEGFAALFHDFKRGVQETLGEEDVESRYDLGIAYREMGLVEDAYEEFLTALQSPARRYDALHMLATSALDVGRAAQALPHLREAIDEGAPEAQQPALRFDLGCLHEALDRPADALESFRFVAGIAPGFRDVEQRIGALQGAEPARGEDAASEAPSVQSEVEAAGSAESFESFEDVVSAVEEADASEAEPIPSPEPVDAPEPLHEPEAVRRVEPAAPPEGAHGSPTPPEPAEPETIDSVSPERDEELERPRTRRRKISFF